MQRYYCLHAKVGFLVKDSLVRMADETQLVTLIILMTTAAKVMMLMMTAAVRTMKVIPMIVRTMAMMIMGMIKMTMALTLTLAMVTMTVIFCYENLRRDRHGVPGSVQF